MSDKIWWYRLPDYDDPYPEGCKIIGDATTMHTTKEIAELAAEKEFYGGIGLDCDWPLMIELFKDGNTKGIYEVDRIAEPAFEAVKAKTPKETVR